jgi:predicted neuraminidase
MATVTTFGGQTPGRLPLGFASVGGAWSVRPMARPARNRSAIAAVTSDRHVAFPGICKAASGALLVCYREGYSHASGNPDDGRVMLVRSLDGGATWSEPELAYDDPAMDDRNAAIACMSDGTIALIWDKYLHGVHHFAWLSTSNDEGRTWREPVRVSETENVHTRSRPLDLSNGTWLIPFAESGHGPTTATHFSVYDPRTGEARQIRATPVGRRECADEVAVTRAVDGRLVALIRSQTDPAFWQIESGNDGETWSEPRLTDIPSQFTPCDLITLDDGRLLCTFSFRERRNERLCVSEDQGATWLVEDSVDLFAGTAAVGGDRSYPASVQIDANTIGTVLYETQEPPRGGHIYFVRTPVVALRPAEEATLHQADRAADRSFLLWPDELATDSTAVSYRFTGLFGPAPNRVGLVMHYAAPDRYAAFLFQMGAAPDRKAWPINHVEIVRQAGGARGVVASAEARGGWFDDGNEHVLGARRTGNRWTFMLDGIEQLSCDEPYWKPRGVMVERAAVAVRRIESS